MITRCLTRFFHADRSLRAAEKSVLAVLRKKTGYTFANCKKALELHNNNVKEAESWLRHEAQALGWSKATKLGGRQTTQGLIGVAVDNDKAVLVEVNCETDFVARNSIFQEMVAVAAKACLKFTGNQVQYKHPLTKIALSCEQLKHIKSEEGKSLADHIALLIGIVGENASLRRAVCLKSDPDIHLFGYAHPFGTGKSDVQLGSYGGIVALKQKSLNLENFEKTGKDLCQHIVGMNPKEIGSLSDKEDLNSDEESRLLYQEYLIDSTVTVNDVLIENGLEVVDFKRFECGENLDNLSEEPLEFVETCQ